MASANPSVESLSRNRFLLLAALIVLVALLLREQFVLITQVDAPIRGDVRQYVAYAYNLVHSGTFSAVDPGTGPVVPDTFRGPGYPLILALVMLARPDGDAWYALALQAQVLLGAGTVLLVIALGRFWLSRAASLGAGVLIAIWPHHIAATGALLSEVLFGFVLVLAAYLSATAARTGSASRGIAAGLAYAYAYLINPVTALFAPLIGVALWRRSRSAALCLILVPALAIAGWALRNAGVPSDGNPGRAAINFVQGAWPDMHVAQAFRFTDPQAVQILHSIDAEARLLSSDPANGLKAMSHRMGEDPRYYVKWYLLAKPYLLWDWDIRIGHGDVYVLEVARSPLDENPALAATKAVLHRLNFAIFLLSGAAALLVSWRFLRGRNVPFAAALVAGSCLYLTLVHVVFQAEPRYSIAYRPFQMLMLITALSWLAGRLRRRLTTAPTQSVAP